MPAAKTAPDTRAARALRGEIAELRRQNQQWQQVADELRQLALALDVENERMYNARTWDGIDPETGEIFTEQPLPRDVVNDVAAFCGQWWGD